MQQAAHASTLIFFYKYLRVPLPHYYFKKANGVIYFISTTIIWKHEESKYAKVRIFKTIFLTVLLYGTDSSTILDKHMAKVTAVEMIYVRRILGEQERTA